MNESLPSDRVFLIRFSSGAEPSAGIHRGRVEHIRSGRTARFSSIEVVEQFIAEILAEEQDSRDSDWQASLSSRKTDTNE